MKHNNIKWKNRYLKFIFIGLLVILLASPLIIWQLKTTTFINSLIIDKTVSNTSYREHKGLVWIMNNLKYFNKATNKPFDYEKDYYGFYPQDGKNYEIKEFPKAIEKPDLIYLTDTYGVYSEDLNKENLRGNRSNAIYGGLTTDEIKDIRTLLNNNTIISEFNTLASPTNYEARKEMEDIFGMEWTGWIGRYFTDLSSENTEVPTWLIKNYEMQYLKFWDFKGPGFAFVKEDDTVVILCEGKDVTNKLNKIVFTEEALKEFKVKNFVDYYYWFDVIKPKNNGEVLATYNLSLTDSGKSMLSKYGIEGEFPAIIRTKGNYTSYYFAGDFADKDQIPSKYQISGLYLLNKLTTIKVQGEQEHFYWNVYYPLMERVLKDIK